MLKKVMELVVFLLGVASLAVPVTTWADGYDSITFSDSNIGAYSNPKIPSYADLGIRNLNTKVAMAPQSIAYNLTMEYLVYLSGRMKHSSFDGLTIIQNDPAYKEIINIGGLAIPALKDAIMNNNMPYQVRVAAMWLIPEICESIGDSILNFKLVQKIAKDAVIFLNEFKDIKASSYLYDDCMMMLQVDAVINTLQEEWNIQPKKGLVG